MAPRKPSRLLEDPPSASPSQEHEEEGVEDSLVEESEEEQEEEEVNELTQKTSQISKLSQMSQKKAGAESSEEEEEASETENEDTKHSPTASSFIIKPAVHKNNHSMEPTKTTTKRALIADKERKDSPKKTKVAKDHSHEDRLETPKKVGASGGRVWNPDDVISILGGIIDYQKQGSDPHADMGAFLKFVKGRFRFEVTRTQLYEKVRSLKKKFFATLGKGESGIPTKPHEIECFELSKKIWGDNNGIVGNSGGNGNGRVVANGVDHTEHVKIVDGEWVTKKSAKSKSSEGKRKGKGEKKKKVSDKKNKKKMDNGSAIVEKELKTVTDEDVENIVQKEAEPVTDDDVRKDNEDVVKAYENGVEEEDEPMSDEDVMKDEETAMKCDKNFVSDDEVLDEDTAQNLSLKYPYFTGSFVDMPESQKTLMMEGIRLLGSEKLRELDDSWKEQRMKEADIFCRKMELKTEQVRLLMDTLKKNR